MASLEQKVGIAMQSILDDDDQGTINVVHIIISGLEGLLRSVSFPSEHDRLFFLVYERVELMNQSSIQPHLWTYRSRITLDHLAQTLQEKKMKEKHPVLYEFLQAVSNFASLVWYNNLICDVMTLCI